jgi:hypothetical protein
MINDKGFWYFAHPYTCKDKVGNYVPAGEEANFRLCCWRSGQLILRGYNIYSPIAHTHAIHVACPELLSRHEHAMWPQLDDDLIAHTNFDGLILAPGWESSAGCVHEQQLFTEMGKPIVLWSDIMGARKTQHEDSTSAD